MSRSDKLQSDIKKLAIQLSIEKNKVVVVDNILRKFNNSVLDLRTICKLESILDEDLLIVPTKKQWRKIKLQRLNEITDGL